MKVLICGGQKITDSDFVYRYLDDFNNKVLITELICSDTIGVNIAAIKWAKDKDIFCKSYQVDVKSFGIGAELVKNKQILSEEKDLKVVLVFEAANDNTLLGLIRDFKKENISIIKVFYKEKV